MFEEVLDLSVLPFFQVSAKCYFCPKDKKISKTNLLSSTSSYLKEKEFAKIYTAWQEDAFLLRIHVDVPFKNATSDFREVDSVELFFDTRDLKTKRFISQFCHHFVFFAKEVDGAYAKEVTRFRGDDAHPLCDPNSFQVTVNIAKSFYLMDITIPAQNLYGYQPQDFKRMGFSYRINRTDGAAQNFSMHSEEYAIESNPHLWGTLCLDSL